LSAGVRIDLAAGALFDDGPDKLQIILPTTYIDTLGFSSNADAVGKRVTIVVTNAQKEQTTLDATVVGVQ
jgi:putative ABC transport system permease protein